MKNVNIIISLLLLVSVLSFCNNSKKFTNSNNQSNSDDINLSFFKGDTIAYLNSIIQNKAKYLDKPLSELLKDLEFPIKKFNSSYLVDNRYQSPSISLETGGFFDSKTSKIYECGPLYIYVLWKTSVPRDSIQMIYQKNGIDDHNKWSIEAETYFGKQIIKDLNLPDYLKR